MLLKYIVLRISDFIDNREKVVIPAEKPYITLSGTQASNTFLIWSDGEDILESPTLTIFASDFVCRFLTIQVNLHHTSYTFIL